MKRLLSIRHLDVKEQKDYVRMTPIFIQKTFKQCHVWKMLYVIRTESLFSVLINSAQLLKELNDFIENLMMNEIHSFFQLHTHVYEV